MARIHIDRITLRLKGQHAQRDLARTLAEALPRELLGQLAAHPELAQGGRVHLDQLSIRGAPLAAGEARRGATAVAGQVVQAIVARSSGGASGKGGNRGGAR